MAAVYVVATDPAVVRWIGLAPTGALIHVALLGRSQVQGSRQSGLVQVLQHALGADNFGLLGPMIVVGRDHAPMRSVPPVLGHSPHLAADVLGGTPARASRPLLRDCRTNHPQVCGST